MRRGTKIFGLFDGVSPEAFERLERRLDFEEVSYDDGKVLVEHDGPVEDIEDIVVLVMEAMDEGYESSLDIIDHDENVLTRFVIEADGFRVKEMNIDDVVQPYPNSQM